MEFKLWIETNNAAFGTDEIERGVEIARILRELADRVDETMINGKCRDINGNVVGEWGFVP